MDISGIISISGMSGLYKVTGQLKNGLVAKSLIDGKNVPVYASNKVSALEDISVFTDSEDVPLHDVFQKIKDKENGGPAPDAKKSDDKTIIAYFGEVLTDYDRERVYKSDMRKIISWYNLLQANDLLKDAAPDAENTEEADKADEALKNFKEKGKGAATKGGAGGDKVGGAQTKGGKATTVRKTGGGA